MRRRSGCDTALIVIDDCSTDASVDVIQRWTARHGVAHQLIQHAHNTGVCASMNDAVRRARGKYVSIISGDDVSLPDKLERQVALFETLPPWGPLF